MLVSGWPVVMRRSTATIYAVNDVRLFDRTRSFFSSERICDRASLNISAYNDV